MFGSLGGAELVAVLVLALLLFGPRKLPQIGRTIGKALSELRKATTDLKMNLEREVDLDQVRKTHDSIRSAGREATDAVKEIRDIGVARGELEDTEPPAPSSEPSSDVEPSRDD